MPKAPAASLIDSVTGPTASRVAGAPGSIFRLSAFLQRFCFPWPVAAFHGHIHQPLAQRVDHPGEIAAFCGVLTIKPDVFCGHGDGTLSLVRLSPRYGARVLRRSQIPRRANRGCVMTPSPMIADCP